jgi:hypothetical protein
MLRGAIPSPALEVSGCAKRQSLVPIYMNRLHTMTAATEVGFSRSERMAGADPSTPPPATDGATCSAGTASFALVTYFKANRAQVAAIGATTSATPTTSGAATPPAVTPAAGTTPTPVTPAAGTTTPASSATAPSGQTASAPTAGAK